MPQNIHQPSNAELLSTSTGEPRKSQFSIKIIVQRGGITQREIDIFATKIEEAATMWAGGNVRYEMG